MTKSDKVFSEILEELREMNRINNENRKVIEQMADYIKDHQALVDVIIKDNRKTNEILMREIRSQLIKLAMIIKPESINDYRTNTKLISNTEEPVYTALLGEKLDGTYQPLYTNDRGYLSVTDPSDRMAILGILYTADTGVQSIDADAYLIMQLTNPAGSGKFIQIRGSLGGSGISIVMELLGNASFTGGTSMTPINTNLGSANTSSANVKWISPGTTDPTTGGNLLFSYITNGGSLEVDFNGIIVVPEDTTLVLRLKNVDKKNDLVATISYWEDIAY